MLNIRRIVAGAVCLVAGCFVGGPACVFAQTSYIGTRAGQVRDDNGLKMKLCWCPAGTFRMGSPADEPDRFVDEAQVEVTFSNGFWLGMYEVTQAEWRQLMGSNPSGFSPDGPLRDKVAGLDTDQFPVERVSREAVSDFFRKLTDQERQAARLPANWEYRLPTEAQWEYACRAGTTDATAFGDKLTGAQANINGLYPFNATDKGPFLRRTTAVGSYKPNAWGLCDMHGNVYELCRDWYTEKLPGGCDPEVTRATSHRVYRGGAWASGGELCRSAFRLKLELGIRDDYLGLRVAAVPAE